MSITTTALQGIHCMTFGNAIEAYLFAKISEIQDKYCKNMLIAPASSGVSLGLGKRIPFYTYALGGTGCEPIINKLLMEINYIAEKIKYNVLYIRSINAYKVCEPDKFVIAIRLAIDQNNEALRGQCRFFKSEGDAAPIVERRNPFSNRFKRIK